MDVYITEADYNNAIGGSSGIKDFQNKASVATQFIDNYCGQKVVADTTTDPTTITRTSFDGVLDFDLGMLKSGLSIEGLTTPYNYGNQISLNRDYVTSVVTGDSGVSYKITGYIGFMDNAKEDIKIAAAYYVQWLVDKLKTNSNVESASFGQLSYRYFPDEKGLNKVYGVLNQYRINPLI